MSIPAEEQEESVWEALNINDDPVTGASGRSPGRLCSRSALQRRRPSNHSMPVGDRICGTQLAQAGVG